MSTSRRRDMPQSTPTRIGHRRSIADILEESRMVDASPTRESQISIGDDALGHSTERADDSCPFGCCERETLSDYIMKKGFFEGACSDITLMAFGIEYRLHRLILSRSGYFSSLFTGPWSDPENSTHELKFDHDPYITQEAFELALARLYGATKLKNEKLHLLNMIAIGQYLDIPELVCTSTDHLVEKLSFKNIAQLTAFAMQNNYGIASERILAAAKGYLCSNGYQVGVKMWDGIPNTLIASVVKLDSFFIPSEWERALFIIKLIERRQKMKDEEDLEEIVEVLNTSVYFCHLTAEQLQKLEGMMDITGKPYVNPTVLRDALWLSIQLHKRVANADPKAHDLGLTTTTEQAPDNVNSWFVPTKDETLYGTPEELQQCIQSHHHIREDLPSGKTTENAGDSLFKVTKIPPFRFSIAFGGVSELEAEKRVYAQTLWYAGSYWNLYIQKIRHRKGYQMGVYIHRATSRAPSRSGLLNKDGVNASMLDDAEDPVVELMAAVDGLSVTDDPEVFDDALTGVVVNGDQGEGCEEDEDEEDDDDDDALLDQDDNDASFLSYEDGRVKTSVYYIIYTPSRKSKTSLTCFISTPDLFKKSQSWGWKSNSMCSFNEDGTLAEGQGKLLKFMVVLGNT